MEFKNYPIYKFIIWVKDTIIGSEFEQSMTSEVMCREEMSKGDLEIMLETFKNTILSRKDWTIQLGDKFEKMSALAAGLYVIKSEITFDPRYESWVCKWFSHSTIDNGEDDEYFLASFEDYVRRMRRFNSENGKTVQYKDGSGSYWSEPVCLMGAEDEWRWHSWVYDDGFDDKNPDTSKIHRSDEVPCRCIYCKRQGIVQINH